jgi:hypothetical protein
MKTFDNNHDKFKDHDPTRVILEHGTGSLEIVPLTATTLQETIYMSFMGLSGHPLETGVLSTSINPAATDISNALFNAHFTLSSPDGDSLFGTYSLTLSDFTSATNETFAGVFTATGGTGAYAGFVGTGTFSGTNVYTDATHSAATTEMSVQGVLKQEDGCSDHGRFWGASAGGAPGGWDINKGMAGSLDMSHGMWR